MPKCIFHLPFQVDQSRASASQIRPLKMLQAFESLGYDAAVVMGRASERRRQGDEIKRRIMSGEHFEFVYSESSTMPTRLTEPNHFPISKSIDFGFLEFCRNHDIKIGLFYRDAYWKFPEYRSIGFLKSALGIAYYKEDLREYNRLLDILFMPTAEAFDIIGAETAMLRRVPLPPGSDVTVATIEKRISRLDGYVSPIGEMRSNPLQLLYVGGIGVHYGFDDLIAILHSAHNVDITFCVRKDDYAVYPRAAELDAMPNVRIAHTSGEGLEALYESSDIAVMLFDDAPYRKAAMPFKTFEYLSHGLPILSNDGTAAARFIRENNVGWVVDFKAGGFTDMLDKLINNRATIAEMSLTCMDVAVNNTWIERARLVAELLSC